MRDDKKHYKNMDWPGPPEYMPAVSKTSFDTLLRCDRKWVNEYPFARHLLPYPQQKAAGVERNLLEGSPKLFAGVVVHDAIEAALRQFKADGTLPPDLPGFGSYTVVHEYVKYSKHYREATNAGKYADGHAYAQPVDRLFFGETFTPVEQESIKRIVRDCLTALTGSTIWAEITQLPSDQIYLQPKAPVGYKMLPIPWFWAGDLAVYASYDVLLTRPEKVTVIDWKTGKRDDDSAEYQLQIYGQFVMSALGVPAEQVELKAVWLSDGAKVAPFSVNPGFLAEQIPAWQWQRQTIRDRVAAAAEDRENVNEYFPMTDKLSRCRFCKYRSCDGYQRLTVQAVPDEEDEDEEWTG